MNAYNLPALGAEFITKETIVAVTANGQVLIGANPNRFTLLFSSQNSSGYQISTTADPTGTTGLFVPQNQLPLVLNFPVHGPLVQQAWYFRGLAAMINVYVLEVIYQPKG